MSSSRLQLHIFPQTSLLPPSTSSSTSSLHSFLSIRVSFSLTFFYHLFPHPCSKLVCPYTRHLQLTTLPVHTHVSLPSLSPQLLADKCFPLRLSPSSLSAIPSLHRYHPVHLTLLIHTFFFSHLRPHPLSTPLYPVHISFHLFLNNLSPTALFFGRHLLRISVLGNFHRALYVHSRIFLPVLGSCHYTRCSVRQSYLSFV